MNIAINAVYFGERAGGAKHLRNLLENLQEIDHVNNYYVFTNRNMYDFINTENSNFHKIIPSVLVNNPVTAIVWRQSFLLMKLKFLKIDLYLDLFNPFIFFKTVKSVAVIRDLGECYLADKYDFFRMFYRTKLMLPLTVKRADKIIAISESTKSDAIKFFNVIPDRIKVIHHGKDEDFKKGKYQESWKSLNERYALSFSNYILHVGRLDPVGKNIIRLIHAFKILKKDQQIDHKLLFVGAPWRNSDIVYNTVKKLDLQNDVVFVGYVERDDLAKFYNVSDILVFPSLFEGFGHPIIEAMSCECPVACSNISSLSEISGGAALLFDPYDIDDIARKAHTLLSDNVLRERLVNKGKENIKRFSWMRNAKEYLTLFREVVGE